MDYRNRFKEILQAHINAPSSITLNSDLISFSQQFVPPVLYRYRQCNKRNFCQLNNYDLAISRPSTFRDDPQDAYIPFEPDKINKLSDLACGPLFDWFCRLVEMSPEERSIEISKQFPGIETTSDLFKGVAAPWMGTFPANFNELSNEAKRYSIETTFSTMIASVGVTDAQNALRRNTMVACLCEDPNSEPMWDEYADHGTGFQVGYLRDSLFNLKMRGCSILIPYILPVIYENVRPVLSVAAMTLALQHLGLKIPNEHPLTSHLRVATFIALYVKNRRLFEHEKEWRVAIFNQSINELSLNYSSRKCPCNFIRLGANISSADASKLREIAEHINTPVYSYRDKPFD